MPGLFSATLITEGRRPNERKGLLKKIKKGRKEPDREGMGLKVKGLMNDRSGRRFP
jgi:hypothetical protein